MNVGLTSMDANRFTVALFPEHGCSSDTGEFFFRERIPAQRLQLDHRGWRSIAFEDGRLRPGDHRGLSGAAACYFLRYAESLTVGESHSEGDPNIIAKGLEL